MYEEISGAIPEPFRIASQQQCEDALSSALVLQGIDYESKVDTRRWGQDLRAVVRYLDKYRRQDADNDNEAFEDPQWISLDSSCRAVLQEINWGQLAFQYIRNLLTGQTSAIDFTEVENLALKMVQQYDFVRTILLARYPWLVIDEYQDLGTLFHKMVRCLIRHTDMRVFAIGDPDQCIYQDMSGTRPEYINQLAEQIHDQEGSGKIVLTRNYRSAQNLIDISERVLGEARDYRATRDGGACECYEGAREQKQRELLFDMLLPRLTDAPPTGLGIPLQDIAILHPWRGSGVDLLSRELDHLADRWPHVLDKDIDYDSSHSETLGWLEQMARWSIYGWRDGDPYFRDLLPFWLRLNTDLNSRSLRRPYMKLQLELFTVLWQTHREALNSDLSSWVERIEEALDLQVLLSHYEMIAPDDVAEYHRFKENLEGDRLSTWTLSRFAKGPGRIQLTTFHSSKGTQFEAVVVMGLDRLERLPPRGVNKQRQRLAYVAMTRARNYVFVLQQARSELLAELRDDPPTGYSIWEHRGSSSAPGWQSRLA